MQNKYLYGSKISCRKFRSILRYFCLEIDAEKTSILVNLNRNTTHRIFNKIRERIAEICESESPFENGEIELDESYFGARRVKGIRGRGAKGKIPVFGMLKRGDKVYTQIINNCSMSELMPIIEAQANKDCIIYTDCFKSYNGLVDFGFKQHYRVKHSDNQFADGRNHINGIENF